MNEILVLLEFNQGKSATNGSTPSSFTHMCPATYKGGLTKQWKINTFKKKYYLIKVNVKLTITVGTPRNKELGKELFEVNKQLHY